MIDFKGNSVLKRAKPKSGSYPIPDMNEPVDVADVEAVYEEPPTDILGLRQVLEDQYAELFGRDSDIFIMAMNNFDDEYGIDG